MGSRTQGRAPAGAARRGDRDRARVLAHWRAVEMFGAQPIPRPDPGAGVTEVGAGDPAPWSRPGAASEAAGEGREWRHAVYLAPFSLAEVQAVLTRLFPPEPGTPDASGAAGHSALAGWLADEDGVPLPGTAVLSDCACALGAVLAREEGAEPPEAAVLRGELADLLAGWEHSAPPASALGEAGGRLRTALGLEAHLQVGVARVRRHRVDPRRDAAGDGVLLNGFFGADLALVERAVRRGDYGHALWRYLAPADEAAPPGRADLARDPTEAARLGASRASPAGRWPAPTDRPPATGQRQAVNAALGELGWSGGLVAVNGPPGTGKTTMLRDLIASIVVGRAGRLADLPRAAEAFGEPVAWGARGGAAERRVHPPRPHVAGDEIVLACATNAAAENVSVEIPARAAVGAEWEDEAVHMPGLASLVLRAWGEGAGRDAAHPGGGHDAWGLIAACLGTRRRGADFARAFWWGGLPSDRDASASGQLRIAGPGGERHPGLHRALAARRSEAAADGEGWARVVAGYRAAEAAEREARASAGDGGEADREFERRRTRLFLAALALHRALLDHAAGPMAASLRAAADLIAGRAPSGMSREAARAAWQALFLVVPVVSTTFASLARLFAHLGREELGWLLVDEAAQVVPQHAAGGIWRARRVVVVGDPRQLEPIGALPEGAREGLRARDGVDATWAGEHASVQALADRVARVGTRDGGDGPWIGVPLTAHRRCEEPMFTIVNRMAYGGRMRNHTGAHPGPDLPPSAWLDVPAAAGGGHWRAAEGDRLTRVLAHLERAGQDLSQVLVLTPFREVARALGPFRSRWPGIEAGTVHTSQGREADVVILVLGGDPAVAGARRWATRRPNLLNVAVSRARRRLWVIGDRAAWAPLPHAGLIARHLPAVPPRG